MSAELKIVGDGFNLDQVLKGFKKEKKELPTILGNLAKNHFVEGFRKGGGQTDDSAGGWKERGTDPGRAILVKSGKLRRDIRVRKKSFSRIVVGTGNITTDYAEAHNKGATMTVTKKQKGYFIAQYNKNKSDFWKRMIGAKTITIPKREYIGHSRELSKKLSKRIHREINRTWKTKR